MLRAQSIDDPFAGTESRVQRKSFFARMRSAAGVGHLKPPSFRRWGVQADDLNYHAFG